MADPPSPAASPAPPSAYSARTKYDAPGRVRRYAERSARRDEEEVRLLAEVLDALDETPRDALDAPCGTGRIAERLLGRGIPTRAADLSPAMRAEAARRLAGRPGFLGVHPLDLEAAEVDPALAADLVVSLRFLHHLPDPATRARVLATLGRLARRDVVLSFHHPVSVHAAWRRLSGWLRRRPSDRHTLSPARLAREAAAAGLRLVSLHPLGRWRRELWLARLVPAPRPGPGGGRTR